VLGEISILASEQVLLDEANGTEEPDGNTSGKKDEKLKPNPNPNPRVLTNETYATESAYMSTTTMRLEAVKAATKLPLRSMFPPCFGVI
jgi:coatomer subunit beta